VDPEKMGITGTSYGGILSMAAVSFAPGLFQAAIPISGYGEMSDFHTMVPELQHIQLLNYELGPYPQRRDVYERHSPIRFVKDATTPTLVLHGSGTEIEWRPEQEHPEMPGLNFARALDQHYKIYRYKMYPAGSYYISGRTSVRQQLLDMLEFFDQFLRDGSSATPAATAAAP
jgi:dipeptidyl aminopeptidase/acylaminoacyl peptidase